MRLLLGEVDDPVAEGLAAVVQREAAGAIAAGGVVHQRDVAAVRVEELLVVVADLMVQQGILAEPALGR